MTWDDILDRYEQQLVLVAAAVARSDYEDHGTLPAADLFAGTTPDALGEPTAEQRERLGHLARQAYELTVQVRHGMQEVADQLEVATQAPSAARRYLQANLPIPSHRRTQHTDDTPPDRI